MNSSFLIASSDPLLLLLHFQVLKLLLVGFPASVMKSGVACEYKYDYKDREMTLCYDVST